MLLLGVHGKILEFCVGLIILVKFKLVIQGMLREKRHVLQLHVASH